MPDIPSTAAPKPGACLRFGIAELMALLLGRHFPYGTLVVNVTGSLLLGFLAESTMANAASREVTIVSTASAPTSDEACRKAQSIAGNGGNPSECACDRRGQVSICRVYTAGPKPAGSPIDATKEKLRDLTKCKPEDKDCKPPTRRDVGTGIHG